MVLKVFIQHMCHVSFISSDLLALKSLFLLKICVSNELITVFYFVGGYGGPPPQRKYFLLFHVLKSEMVVPIFHQL